MKLSCLKNKLFLLLLILLLAFCIRIYHLNAENLDLAEAYRFTEADSLDGAFYKTLNYEEHPPAYNIFLYFMNIF